MDYIIEKKKSTNYARPLTKKEAKARFYKVYGILMSLAVFLVILAKVI